MEVKSLIFPIFCILISTAKSNNIPDVLNDAVWKWDCVKGQCEKSLITDENKETALSLGACKMFCNDYGNIWPSPTGKFQMGNHLVHLNRNSIDVIIVNMDGMSRELMDAAKRRFNANIQTIIPSGSVVKDGGKSLVVNINVRDSDRTNLTLDTDESYSIQLKILSDGRLNCDIKADNFFGARHALETLSQLIIFDDIRGELQIIRDLEIEDKPVYPYRGLLLDTARNYFDVDSIKRSLDGMAACKLNRFHWHITDSQSFSFKSKSHPNLSRLGSITPSKVYTVEQIKDVIRYAVERGIRVIPEFDAPAHVGEGWQGTDLTVCFKKEPWRQYCVEPPCGQLNPTRDELYEVLQGIYDDMFEAFQPDIFHMGGDEVTNECWNSSAEIQQWMLKKGWGLEKKDFLKLWEHFQTKAQQKAYLANGGKKLPLVLWTSTLTEFNHIDEFLSNEDYIIQVWTKGDDPEIAGLLSKGYKLIISNYDALYFDCGFGAWVGEGNNWCSPYIGWQKVYDNSLYTMAGPHTNLILGGEAALWSEQADTSALDIRLWPRSGALAERLWAEPKDTWRNAERRMLHFRERLVNMGIAANTLQPEWCYQNEGYCYA